MLDWLEMGIGTTLGIAAVRELAVMQTIRITNVPILFTCSTELHQALIVAMLLLGAVCQTYGKL